jgi:Mor family transcriptional regulator
MHPLLQIKRENWPQMLSDLAEVIGEDTTLKLFTRFAGRHLCVPETCPPGHLIEETIGAEKAAQLCQTYQRELLIFPTCALLLIKIRNQNMLADRQAGMRQCDIATKYQVSARTVCKIVGRRRDRSVNP